MINHNLPFFRFPFYMYPRNYSQKIYTHSTNINSHDSQNNTPPVQNENVNQDNVKKDEKEKKSSKYSYIGPILINTNGFSNKEEPLLEFSGLQLYLDDIIILSLPFFLYKENVKDDMLFILLILLLIT